VVLRGVLMAEPAIDTHNLRIDFGRHRGQPYTRAPIAYLRWMIDCGHSRADVAKAELQRRGIALVDEPIVISGHAVDSASLRVWRLYRSTRLDKKEGLNSWLIRVCTEAMAQDDVDDDDAIHYQGMKLVLVKGELIWTLKTVMRDNT